GRGAHRLPQCVAPAEQRSVGRGDEEQIGTPGEELTQQCVRSSFHQARVSWRAEGAGGYRERGAFWKSSLVRPGRFVRPMGAPRQRRIARDAALRERATAV